MFAAMAISLGVWVVTMGAIIVTAVTADPPGTKNPVIYVNAPAAYYSPAQPRQAVVVNPPTSPTVTIAPTNGGKSAPCVQTVPVPDYLQPQAVPGAQQ